MYKITVKLIEKHEDLVEAENEQEAILNFFKGKIHSSNPVIKYNTFEIEEVK